MAPSLSEIMVTIWKKLSEEAHAVGYRKMLKRMFQFPDGQEARFDIKDEGSYVVIVGLTPDKQVIMAKQFRPGPEKILIELPGGGIDPGEEPMAAAAREFLEETGYAGDLKLVGSHLISAYSTGKSYVFVATNCQKVAEPQNSHGEFIDVEHMTLDEFLQHLRSGELSDVAAGYRAFDYLKLL